MTETTGGAAFLLAYDVACDWCANNSLPAEWPTRFANAYLELHERLPLHLRDYVGITRILREGFSGLRNNFPLSLDEILVTIVKVVIQDNWKAYKILHLKWPPEVRGLDLNRYAMFWLIEEMLPTLLASWASDRGAIDVPEEDSLLMGRSAACGALIVGLSMETPEAYRDAWKRVLDTALSIGDRTKIGILRACGDVGWANIKHAFGIILGVGDLCRATPTAAIAAFLGAAFAPPAGKRRRSRRKSGRREYEREKRTEEAKRIALAWLFHKLAHDLLPKEVREIVRAEDEVEFISLVNRAKYRIEKEEKQTRWKPLRDWMENSRS